MTDFPRPTLTLVTDRKLYRPGPDKKADPLSLIEAAIEGGVNIVQLRARGTMADDIGLYAVALRLREMTAGIAKLVITGDVELAEKSSADGVLLLERSYKPSDARAFLRGADWKMVGGFARSVVAAGRAERGGADYIQFAPVFDSDHPLETVAGDAPGQSNDVGTGLVLLRKIKDAVHIPVIAFGGILTPEHVVDCLRFGADGIAVTDAITRATDPHQSTRSLRTAMDAAWRALYGA